MRRFLFLIFILEQCSVGLSQSKLNNEWVQGVLFKSSIVRLDSGQFKFNRYYDTVMVNKNWFMQGSNICDSSGSLLLASNGFNVMNNNAQFLDGLDSIGGRGFMQYCAGIGMYNQYSLFLPFSNGLYYFINNSISDSYWNYYQTTPGAKAIFDELLYCRIDMKGNAGNGKVLDREIKLVAGDSLSKTEMMACKHANGRDWWLFKRASRENRILKFLFTEDTVYTMGQQMFMEPVFSSIDNGGQSMFSQDGTKFATTCRGTGQIFVADFDRCTGLLSNPKVFLVDSLSAHNPQDTAQRDFLTEGLAFSPNGRFLYVYMYFNIQQLDLWDSNPATRWSVVAGLDTTWEAFQSYSNMQLGPDNKLYVGNWGSVLCKQMSYFNNPNAKGLASDFCPRCLRFPAYGVTRPPNMPNYDLGPTGQPCWPLSQSEIDESAAADVLLVYPNPAHNRLYIQTESKGERMLFNALGQLVQRTKGNELDVSALPAGVYWLRVGNRVKKVLVE